MLESLCVETINAVFHCAPLAEQTAALAPVRPMDPPFTTLVMMYQMLDIAEFMH